MNREEAAAAGGTGFDVVPTREGYDRWSAIYDAEDNPLIALETPRVTELLGDVNGLAVADIGCGTGRHTIPLVRAGARVTAVDFSRGMLSRAAGKPGWEQVRLIEHDLAEELPLQTGAFDRVLCALVLEHVVDLDAVLRELGRVCKREGWIVVSELHPAMALRGVQARFVDPASAREIRPAGRPRQISDYVMAAVRAGLAIEHLSEHAADEALAARCERARKYVGWPMLFMLRLRPGGRG